MIHTKNFNPNTDPKLICTCGHLDCDKRSVNQFTLDRLQMIRDDYGHPITVTSGGRCPNHPDELRKAKEGDHQKCTTVDIQYKNDIERVKLLVLAGRHGATRVAEGSNFLHLSWTETNDRSVPTWRY